MDHERASDALLISHIATEDKRQEDIEKRLAAIEASMKEMTDAWTQAKGALTLIKVLAGIATGIAAVYAFMNTNFTITPK